MTYTLLQGDCLDILPTLADGSIDAVICDPPYGTTQCAWDSVIPLAPMWEQLKRVVKPSAAIVLFGAQPFTSVLVSSNLQWFRQELIWDKVLPVGFLDCNRKHLRRHENILLFSPAGRSTYNPQMTRRGEVRQKGSLNTKRETPVYGKYEQRVTFSNVYYPTSIVVSTKGDHTQQDDDANPTQKPVDLMRYLVRTYSNPGDTVLDFTMGSGSTGVACRMEGRNFIGIDNDTRYFRTAERRIQNAQPPLFVEDAPMTIAEQAVLL